MHATLSRSFNLKCSWRCLSLRAAVKTGLVQKCETFTVSALGYILRVFLLIKCQEEKKKFPGKRKTTSQFFCTLLVMWLAPFLPSNQSAHEKYNRNRSIIKPLRNLRRTFGSNFIRQHHILILIQVQQHSTTATTVPHPSLSQQSQQQQQQTSSKTEHLVMNGPSSAGASSVSTHVVLLFMWGLFVSS